MSVKVIRRQPPLLILLDVLMLWVLALVSMPMEKRGVTYKFLGLPQGSVLFEVTLPLDPNQAHWRHFDFTKGTWIAEQDITPHGRENFMCDECAEFLPADATNTTKLMIGLPVEMSTKIHDAFFEACRDGNCGATTLYINKDGSVTTSAAG
ncbi:MAG: hypothetical protein AB2796_05265 [Candidatus Thiodiazotropha sp.]